MELHHRLRRDPSWDPRGCNICGQVGHQAANCTTGTVNWRALYGEHAFVMKPARFWSDEQKAKEAKLVNAEELEQRARDYAKMRAEGGAPPQLAPPQGGAGGQRPPSAAAAGHAPHAAAAVAAAAKPAPTDEEAARRAEAERDLPAGWAVAFDASKKPYFWHKTTKKTMWEKPKPDTPINGWKALPT
ncbi:E3 ubiquitin-ligase Su(dx) [Micractinium conductrix]|uniref:E3 ubiquitin-ligase Su(Dx) n=1 Tax=Micractinium conductrix TaxID=554055 RepID=A0A2P6VIB7_9CHLO|nr:E3 ubiquitin-ligase Su(dx) [Micractinium conductrix]|eukprot:PSC73831.1 E3 ubiquitin-ligase Su(dx) [Micractinium conductrix]